MKYFLVLFFTLAIGTAQTLEDVKINVKFLYDKDLTIHEAIQHDELYLQEYKKMHRKSIKWIKFRIENNLDTDIKKIIRFMDMRVDKLSVYSQSEDLITEIGEFVAFDSRKYQYESKIAFDVTIPAQQANTYYIHVDSKNSYDLSYQVLDEPSYIQLMFTTKQMYAFYFGIMIVMLVYNFIVYLFIREKVFLIYVAYHVVLLINMMYYSGYIVMYHEPSADNMSKAGVPGVLIAISNLLAIFFIYHFLNLKETSPRFYKVLQFFGALFFILFLAMLFLGKAYYLPRITVALMMPLSIVLLLAGFYLAFVKKSTLALFYSLSWIMMMLGVIITALLSEGLIPRLFITDYAFQIGSIFEVTLLSMGLSYRYNEQQREIYKKDAQLRSINANLEKTIETRTKELYLSNEKLKDSIIYKQNLLRDREVLFKELYHRVKNNLQVVISILGMQSKRLVSDESKEVLQEANGRIKSMALIHEKLQNSDDLNSVDMQDYIESLLKDVLKGYALGDSIKVQVNSENLYLPLEHVSPIGLILNELTSNSLKHAFDATTKASIEVTLVCQNDKQYILSYKDNGKGFDQAKQQKSLGSLLIETLSTKQLHGTMTTNGDSGFYYEVIFFVS